MSTVAVKVLFKNRTMNKILIALCAFIIGLTKAVADTWLTHFSSSLFSKFPQYSFFGEFSWARKYADYETLQGSAFLFSKTLLVAFTDVWHLSNAIGFLGVITALYLFSISLFSKKQALVLIACFIIIRDLTFHFFYTYFLLK